MRGGVLAQKTVEFKKNLKFFIDVRVSVANMLDNFHAKRSSSVSSVKKTKLG